jgi:hypothetical protein
MDVLDRERRLSVAIKCVDGPVCLHQNKAMATVSRKGHNHFPGVPRCSKGAEECPGRDISSPKRREKVG